MKKIIYSIAAVLCAASLPIQVLAYELEYVDRLAIANGIAQAVLKQDQETVCSAVAETSLCKLEFDVADKAFYVVDRLLMMAAIAHQGRQRERLIERAKRRYDQAWLLYEIAVAENTLVDESSSRESVTDPLR